MAKQKALTFGQLVDYVEGKLGAEETAVVATQIAQADAETQATVAWLQNFWQMSQEVQLVAPSSDVRQKLMERFAAYAKGRQQPSIWQQVVAQLTFDSWAAPQLAGARAGAGGAEWPQQLIYTSNIADIALTIDNDREQFTLSGQIFSPKAFSATAAEASRFVVQLHRNAQQIDFLVADELGEFAFPALTAGTYDLLILDDAAKLHIPSVKLHKH